MRDFYLSGRLSQYLLWLACAAGVAGLLASRALVALSPAAGMAAVFANPNLRRDFANYFRSGAAMRAAAMYGLFVLSTLYTSDWPVWRHELYRLLPWIGVPLIFTVAVPLAAWQRLVVGCLFTLGTASVGLATLANYFVDPGAANEAIAIGQNMPSVTRIFHIHFGIMLGLAFFSAVLLRRSALVRSRPGLRGALLLAAVGIVATLHILAYRTGLLVFYAGLLGNVLRLLWQRHVVAGVGLLVLLVAGPWLAISYLRPVQQRLGATRWDIEQFTQGHDINDYSLARRLAAWQTAGEIIRRQPLLGVGTADAQQAMMQQYEHRSYGLRLENRAMVHNQYLHYLVSSGIVGLILWLALLLWPLAQPGQRRNPYIWHFLLISGTGMLVDSLLEMQIGFNLFVFGYGFLVVAGEQWRRPLPAVNKI